MSIATQELAPGLTDPGKIEVLQLMSDLLTQDKITNGTQPEASRDTFVLLGAYFKTLKESYYDKSPEFYARAFDQFTAVAVAGLEQIIRDYS